MGPFRSTTSIDLVLSNVKMIGKKDPKTHDKIVIFSIRNLICITIISIAIIVYSFYTHTLIWGFITVVLIMILTFLMSGFILLVKILLISNPSTARED